MVAPRLPVQVLRAVSLLLPSAVAWEVASLTLHRTRLDEAIAQALGPLWLATLGALAIRGLGALARRHMGWLEAVEVLTASGSSMAWSGAAAVLLSVAVGWASLAVVGLLGLCVLHVVALWTLTRAGGSDPWRRASLTRRFMPGTATEGGPLIEEVRLVEPRIPTGFRLLASGRVGPRWPVSRYVVSAQGSRGETVLESDVGPALRGAHDVEPLRVWLQDVLGLCRSRFVLAGGAELTVLPRPTRIEGVRALLDAGGHAGEPRPATRLPTEGSFRLREYAVGDDARRIHWLRSLTARELVVRLPDELPPDRPAVRLVLDTFHPVLATSGACDASSELLDAMVRVWLGVGACLVGRGVRVALVAALPRGGEVASERRALHLRAPGQGQGLGARACWQGALAPADLVTGEATLVVSHRLPDDDVESEARWIVVPSGLWTSPPERDAPLNLFHAFPLGSADNRVERRRAGATERRRERALHDALHVLTTRAGSRRSGNLLARPRGADQVDLEVLS